MQASFPATTSASATPTFIGAPSRLAGDRHPSLLGLHDEVVAGAIAVRAEAGDRAPHETGLCGENRRDVESISLEHAALEVVDDDVGARDQATDERAIVGIGEIGDDALLVAVDAEVIGALAGAVEGRTPAAGVVAGAGSLDLDDVGAEVAEQHARERARQDSAQIEHVDSC